MDQEPKFNSNWTFGKIIKVIPTIIVGVSSSCFILGLLVVNIYLAQYGIYSKEFLRTEYVLAGAVFILLITTAEISITYLLKWLRDVRVRWIERKFISVLLSPLKLILPLLSIPIVLLFLNGNNEASLKLLWHQVTGVFIACLMYRAIFLNIKTTFKSFLSQKDNSMLHERLSELLFPILWIIIGLTVYAKATYPHISAIYGGGNRAPATIFLTPRGIEVCKALALPISANQTAGPLEVLTESDKELTILIENGFSDQKVAIQLNKDLLDVIQTRTQNIY